VPLDRQPVLILHRNLFNVVDNQQIEPHLLRLQFLPQQAFCNARMMVATGSNGVNASGICIDIFTAASLACASNVRRLSVSQDPQIAHGQCAFAGMELARRDVIRSVVLTNGSEDLTILNCNGQPWNKLSVLTRSTTATGMTHSFASNTKNPLGHRSATTICARAS
jgi:hypothetical protein